MNNEIKEAAAEVEVATETKPKRKRSSKTKPVTISMKPELWEAGQRQAEELGLSFSSYICMMIAQNEKSNEKK